MNRNQLLPPELLQQIPALYYNEGNPADKTIIKVKYFLSSFTWLVTECKIQENDVLFYGYVINHSYPDCSEWCYFTLNQLMGVRLFGCLGVERDLYFKECTFGAYMKRI